MLQDALDQLAFVASDALLGIEGKRRITVSEALTLANKVADAIRAEDLLPGARVAIIAKNSIWHVITLFAVLKAGATVVPLNYRLRPDEWQFILDDCSASLVFIAPEFAPVAPTSAPVVVMGEWDQWLAKGSPSQPSNIGGSATADAVQLYTSGTMGKPKGVIWTHEGLEGCIEAVHKALGIRPGDRILLALPMFHIFGAVMAFLSVGCSATLLLIADFQPAEIIRILVEEHVAVAPLVPAMIQACLAIPDVGKNQFPELRTMVYGASTIAERTLRNAAAVFGCGFIQLYGMSELSPISALSVDDHALALASRPELLLSAGRALPGVEVRITDAYCSSAPVGVQGEIAIRSSFRMSSYFNRPEEQDRLIRDGWLYSGDSGVLDAEGYLFIQDRIKDIIISAAENISPREVEEILFQMPEISDVAVIGVPHEQWGEAVHAVVVPRRDVDLKEAEVVSFARERLARFKCPKSVEFVNVLPRNSTGKLLKRQLREQYWRDTTRNV